MEEIKEKSAQKFLALTSAENCISTLFLNIFETFFDFFSKSFQKNFLFFHIKAILYVESFLLG